ncbi:uncharacterized protein O3C94_003030, partial [Discoglossus pictus]
MASETPGSAVSVVGQGSVLGKSSLHMVGYMGKNPESYTPITDGSCPACKAKGQIQSLRTYRISFTQSIFLCANPQCIYPLGYTPLDNIIANTADLKKRQSPPKPRKRSILEAAISPKTSVKKYRSDASVCGESISVPQNGSYKFLHGSMTSTCNISSPLVQNSYEGRDLQEQNVMENSSSGISGLQVNYSSPSSCNVPHGEISSVLLQEDHTGFQEGAAPNKVMEMTDSLNRSSATLQNGHSRLLETAKNPLYMFSSPSKILMVSGENNTGQCSGFEKLSRDPGLSKNEPNVLLALSDKGESKLSTLTDHLQNIQPEHVEENSSMEMSTSLCSGSFGNDSSNMSVEAAPVPDCIGIQTLVAAQDSQEKVCDVMLSNNLLQDTQGDNILVKVSTSLCNESAVKDTSNVSMAGEIIAQLLLLQDSQEKMCDVSLSNDLSKSIQPQPEHHVNEGMAMETSKSNTAATMKDNNNESPARAPLPDVKSFLPIQDSTDISYPNGFLKGVQPE